jgi:hypothetical protein
MMPSTDTQQTIQSHLSNSKQEVMSAETPQKDGILRRKCTMNIHYNEEYLATSGDKNNGYSTPPQTKRKKPQGAPTKRGDAVLNMRNARILRLWSPMKRLMQSSPSKELHPPMYKLTLTGEVPKCVNCLHDIQPVNRKLFMCYHTCCVSACYRVVHRNKETCEVQLLDKAWLCNHCFRENRILFTCKYKPSKVVDDEEDEE